MPRLHYAVLLALCAPACDNGSGAAPPIPGDGEVGLEQVASGLSFPVHVTAPPGDARVFIVEKSGRIKILRGGQVVVTPFLDLSDAVSGGSEQGLLSLAFHPQYASNVRFVVNYTDLGGDTQVVEFRVSSDPDRADPATARTLLSVDQPFSNHNGGLVVFGPDGRLYVGMGDGGGGGDPQDVAQDLSSLLGKLLRLTPDGGVPADNPFVGNAGARGEIWASGLRNPWRFAFDRETGDLYIADVGQNRLEEVNAVRGAGRGLDYGWDTMEGSDCFEPSSGCNQAGLTLPVISYDHGEGCSVTGGHVYRGTAIPGIRGLYFYSDYCSGFVRSFRFTGAGATDERRWADLEPGAGDRNVTSFGEDAAGEIYITTAGGNVYKFVSQ